MIVIASIHQPATSTYLLFDNVLLLSQGKSVYFGPPNASQQYFESLGYPRDAFLSPAESMLQLVNTDFGSEDECKERLDQPVSAWNGSTECRLLREAIRPREATAEVADIAVNLPKGYPQSLPAQVGIQLHRLFLVVLGWKVLILESIPRSTCIRRSYRNVPRSRHSDGNGMVEAGIFSMEYSKCHQCFILWQRVYEFHGTLSLPFPPLGAFKVELTTGGGIHPCFLGRSSRVHQGTRKRSVRFPVLSLSKHHHRHSIPMYPLRART
jgi:hypothetical protein